MSLLQTLQLQPTNINDYSDQMAPGLGKIPPMDYHLADIFSCFSLILANFPCSIYTFSLWYQTSMPISAERSCQLLLLTSSQVLSLGIFKIFLGVFRFPLTSASSMLKLHLVLLPIRHQSISPQQGLPPLRGCLPCSPWNAFLCVTMQYRTIDIICFYLTQLIHKCLAWGIKTMLL